MISVHWGDPRGNAQRAPVNLSAVSSIQSIIADVAKKYRVSNIELISQRRSRYIAWPRQEVMFRAFKETTLSLPAIGRHLGGRDHTTILHGIRQHEKRMKEATPSGAGE